MPCFTLDYPDEKEVQASKLATLLHEKQLKVADATLCAAIKTFGEEFINQINLQDSGLTVADVKAWWAQHQKEDKTK